MTIMIGIDPHKATHTAVAIDSDERVLDEFTVRASKAQASRLRTWASQFDDPAWAVESARGLGYLLSQQLVAAGETVFDVPCGGREFIRAVFAGFPVLSDRLVEWSCPVLMDTELMSP